MARPAGAPGPDPWAESSAAGDLAWWELADGLWLASVAGSERRAEPPATDQPAADPARGTESPSGTPPRAGQGPKPGGTRPEAAPQRLPACPPPGRPALPELQLLPGERGAAPHTRVAIREAAAITRALRPLKRRVRSTRPADVVFDADATAERAVQDGLWWPITRPQRHRWLNLTLVVDGSPSMVLWQSRVTAFVRLLEQLGAFRTIQVRRLDTRPGTDGAATPVLRGATPATPTRSPDELTDPSGRRVVLVVTDGVGDCWRHDLISPLLSRWGRAMPVAVVNLLPQRLWARNGLTVERARLTTPAPLRPNGRWDIELPDAWLAPHPAPALPDDCVPVPILELRARWLGRWARLITSVDRDPVDAPVLLTSDKPQAYVAGHDVHAGGEPSPRERVDHFRSVASPTAFKLATILAALPVSLPVARVVQSELMPEADVDHLAEVLTSGLLHPADRESTWDTLTFNFPVDIREFLLAGARRSLTARAVRVAAERLGDRIGTLARLRRSIDDPDGTPDPELPAEMELERVVMRALSGPYLPRADRLSSSVAASASLSREPVPENSAPARAKSGDMSNTAERGDISNQPPAPSTPTPATPDIRAVPPWSGPHHPGTDAQPGPPTTPIPQLARIEGIPAVWGPIPPRNPNFTGRAELLDQLSKRLTAGGTTVVLPAALHGMGGIGKTQMAIEYIYRHLADYDIIWWLQAAQPTQIRAGLAELARQLRLPGGGDPSTAVPIVLEALRTGRPFRRWLLVFDAAESPEAVRPYFPANGPGEILITSRNPDWAGVARPLEIAVFRREESKELLRRRGPEIDDDGADRLADKLGDLPLAVEQAAAWLAETGMPVDEYLRLFDEKISEILDSSTPPGSELSVAAAWNVSFDQLRVRNPAAHQILQICAFFAAEPIPRDLFTGVRGVSISAELDVALRDPIQLARAIRDISRYGLAKIDHSNNTIQLHRLVQLVLRDRLTPHQQQAQMRHGAHQLLATLDPNDPENSRHWPRYRELLPHAYTAELVDCEDTWARQLVINLGRFLFQWGDHDESVELLRSAYKHFTEKMGPTDSQTLETAWRLGGYLTGVGRYKEAAELNQKTLEHRLRISGENSEEALGIQINIVFDLHARGDFAAARKLSEEIYLKSRKLYGDDDPDALEAAYQFSVNLRYTGEYRAARELDEVTYGRRVEILGHDHPRTYYSLMGIILDRRELGDYVWARLELEKLTELAWKLYGDERKITWTRSHQLSIARRKDGDHTGAFALSGPAMAQLRLSDGDEKPIVMAAALAHSIDLRHASELPAARRLGEETFDIHRKVLGENHPYTMAASVDLAVSIRLSGDAATARQLDERAFEQLRASLGPDHPYSILTAINLATDLAALGESPAALEIDTEAHDRAARMLGPDHPTTLAASLNLVLDLRTAGRGEEAETRYADTMARFRRVLGEEHPATAAAARGMRADCDIDPMPL